MQIHLDFLRSILVVEPGIPKSLKFSFGGGTWWWNLGSGFYFFLSNDQYDFIFNWSINAIMWPSVSIDLRLI